MRKILLLCGGFVILLIAAVAALILFVDVNQFRGQIQSGLQKELGRDVALGDMKLSILPLSIRVADVRISEDPKFQTGKPFATASEISVQIALMPLLRKELQVQSLVVKRPEVELVRNASQHWNYESIVNRNDNDSSSGGLQLDSLELEDGRIAVSDLAARNARTEYDHIGLLLKNFKPGKPFQGKLTAHLDGSKAETVSIEGEGGPLKDKSAPFKGKLKITDASLAAMQKFLNRGKPATLDGTLNADADLSYGNDTASVRGRMEISKAKLQGKDLGAPVKMDFDLQDNLESGLLRIASLKLGVDKVPLTVAGDMNTKSNALNLSARTSGAELADIFTLANLFGVRDVSGTGKITLDVRVRGTTENPDYSGSGQVQNASLQLATLTKPMQVQSASLQFTENSVNIGNLGLSLGSTNAKGELAVRNFSHPDLNFRLDADKVDVAELQSLVADAKQESSSSSDLRGKGSIKIGRLTYEQIAFQNVDAQCTMERGSISLSPVTADLFGGKQSGSITLDTKSKPAILTLNTKLDGVEANDVLSATTSLKKTLYGLLAAQGNASLKLASDKDMARGLNGDIKLNLTKGRIAGINLLNEVASIAKFLGYAKSNQSFTNLVLLTGDIAIHDGIATTDNLQLLTDSGSVAAHGTVNLVDQSLNLKMTTVLDKTVSEKSGGSQIGGFLTTALANQKGELVIPATVTGTFAAPRFAPDAAEVAKLKLKSFLPGLSNPSGGAKPGSAQSVIDAIAGKPAGKEGNTGGGLFDVLNSLKKKKAQQ